MFSLLSDGTGKFNTGVGAGTLLSNTADQNTATGAGALLSNTTANSNTAIGAFALFSNTTGGTLGNTMGFTVGPNTAVGSFALQNNTIASANTAAGYQALANVTTESQGTDLGLSTAVGFQTLANATGGGGANSGFGYQALFNNTNSIDNVAVGAQALFSNTIGNGNTTIGDHSLGGNTTGDNNTALGFGTLSFNTTGSGNTVLGHDAGASITTAINVICIGANGMNVDDSCFIGNIFNATASGGIPVLINSNNQLGTTISSKRFKEEIKVMEQASVALCALKPVTFRYKKEIDPVGTPQLGLVAEDVEVISPDLVVRDKEGKPYSVRYDQINAMLLNEFLKEHRKAQAQQQALDSLRTELREQRDLIQKLSDKVEVSTTKRQVAVSNP